MSKWVVIGFKVTESKKTAFKKKVERLGLNQSVVLTSFFNRFMSDTYENAEEFNQINQLTKRIVELEESLKKNMEIQQYIFKRMNVN